MNGETFYVPMGGGAGYGDVLERDPGMVLKDVKKGMCTHWAASNLYKIVYDEKTLRLDAEKTELLRDGERRERLKRGKKYNEFELEWSKLKPPEKILEYYGTYPHPLEGINTGKDGM